MVSSGNNNGVVLTGSVGSQEQRKEGIGRWDERLFKKSAHSLFEPAVRKFDDKPQRTSPEANFGELSGIGETGINSGRRLIAGLVYVGVLIHQVPEAHTRS
jgi:hypothetical protein